MMTTAYLENFKETMKKYLANLHKTAFTKLNEVFNRKTEYHTCVVCATLCKCEKKSGHHPTPVKNRFKSVFQYWLCSLQ